MGPNGAGSAWHDFCRMTPAMTSATIGKERPHSEFFVELENVTLTYGRGERQISALGLTNLRLKQGDFVALVGPSGCGKSTILKLVTGLLSASSGYVYIAGREVGAEPVRVGMAFQNPTMLPWLTVRDNVMLPLKIVPPFRENYRSKRKTEFRDRAEALLEGGRPRQFRRQAPMAIVRRHAAAGLAVPRAGA